MTEPPATASSPRRRVGWFIATVLAGVLGVYCLLGTRQATSGTFDESNHLACGLEWWQYGSYTQWTENPPLPRVAIAALPYLLGTRLPAQVEWDPKTHDWDRSWDMGAELLYGGDGYETNLRRARWGTLPFFLLTLLSVWGLSGGRRSPAVGFIAVALTATLPTLTAHGALATTDVPFVGSFALASLALWRWFGSPTWGRAMGLGAAVGLALLCKFSTLAFFPVLVAAVLLARRLAKTPVLPRWGDQPLPTHRLAMQVVGMFLASFFVTWAGYRFSVGRIEDLASEVKDWLPIVPPAGSRGALASAWLHATLPMPELFHGLRFLAAHNRLGHESYLLGWISQFGFRTFYPVALLVKTPLPFLALWLLSLPLVWRRRSRQWPALATLLAATGILLVSLASHVNIGVRHVAVILPLLAVQTALAIGTNVGANWDRKPAKYRWLALGVVGTLLLAHATIAVRNRASAIGYFNALAGAEPAKVLLDSDLDWGQDLFALRREAKARGIDALSIAFFGTLRQCQHQLPKLTALLPGRPTKGWIAISENYYQERSMFVLLKDPCQPKSFYGDNEVPPKPFTWLRAYQPVATVGSAVRLYYIN